MSLHDRAVSLLRLMNVDMHQQLADVDFKKLQAIERASDNEKRQTRWEDHWIRILTVLAPHVTRLSDEIKSIKDYANKQKNSTIIVIILIIVVAEATTLTGCVLTRRILQPEDGRPIETKLIYSMVCAICVVMTLGMLVVVSKLLINRVNTAMYYANDMPIMVRLHRINELLARSPLWKYVWHYTNMTAPEVSERDSVDATEYHCKDEDASKDTAMEVLEMELCKPVSMRPPISAKVISQFSTATKRIDMLTILQDIRNDVKKFDRVALWDSISQKIGKLKQLVTPDSDRHSGGIKGISLTKDGMEKLFDHHIVPIFKVHGVEITGYVHNANTSMPFVPQKCFGNASSNTPAPVPVTVNTVDRTIDIRQPCTHEVRNSPSFNMRVTMWPGWQLVIQDKSGMELERVQGPVTGHVVNKNVQRQSTVHLVVTKMEGLNVGDEVDVTFTNSKSKCYRICSTMGKDKCAWATYDPKSRQCTTHSVLVGQFEPFNSSAVYHKDVLPVYVARGAGGQPMVCGKPQSTDILTKALTPMKEGLLFNGFEDAQKWCSHNSNCKAIEQVSNATYTAWGGDNNVGASGFSTLLPPRQLIENAICVKASSSDLVETASVSSVVSMFHNMTESMAQDIVDILGRYRFAINLDERRDRIDYEIRSHYGNEAWNAGISESVDVLMEEVRRRIREEVSPKKTAVVTHTLLLDVLKKYTSMQWMEIARDARSLYLDCFNFRMMFPPNDRDNNVNSIIIVANTHISIVALISFGCLLTILTTRIKSNTISTGKSVMIALTASSVIGIALVVIAGMCSKLIVRKESKIDNVAFNSSILVQSSHALNVALMTVAFKHKPPASCRAWEIVSGFTTQVMESTLEYDSSVCNNLAAVEECLSSTCGAKGTVRMEDNTVSVQSKMDTPEEELSRWIQHANNDDMLEYNFAKSLDKMWHSGNEQQSLLISTQVLGSVTQLIAAYESCNMLNQDPIQMPFPSVDMFMYVTIILALLMILTFAFVYADPAEKASNIRLLMSLKRKVMRGETLPDLQSEITCCAPDEALWTFFKWMGVVSLVVINIWLMADTNSKAASFKAAMSLGNDC